MNPKELAEKWMREQTTAYSPTDLFLAGYNAANEQILQILADLKSDNAKKTVEKYINVGIELSIRNIKNPPENP